MKLMVWSARSYLLDFLGIELTAAFGSDEHHAVGTLVAIECGGSSILQYGYALHFLGRGYT